MGLISKVIPNLINGVSQQPDSIRLPTQCREMENCLPSVVEFLKRRPATKHVAKLINGGVGAAKFHKINRDLQERYIVVLTDGDLRVYRRADGSPMTVNFPEGKTYLAGVSPKTDLQLLTINDYTFVLNRMKTVAMDAALSEDRGAEALVFIKQASYATDYKITLDGATVSYSTPATDANGVRTTAIAQELVTKLKAINAAYDVQLTKSTIWVRRTDKADFTITCEDSRSNTHIGVVKDKAQKFSDLLTVAPRGFVCEIVGDQTSNFDNYFVKFVPDNAADTFNSGIWEETVKPGIPFKFDAKTMPHVLVREADGTFTFRAQEWSERGCGDEKSNPEPTFVGRRISSVFFYRNRLSLLSEENVIMSETGEFFNFWKTTVTTEVDNNPIDTAASFTSVTSLKQAASFSGGLLLLSDNMQFRLKHDDVLSNATVAVLPATEFDVDTRANPASSGKTVFFATSKGGFSGVREYFSEDDEADAADITAHIPMYIPNGIFSLESYPNEELLIVLSEGAPKTVFVYKYYWNGKEKLQSSWGKWTYHGDVLAADADTLLIEYADGVYLETFAVEPGTTDEHAPFEFYLDRKVSEQRCLMAYNPITDTTTIAVPYWLEVGMRPVVVSRHHPDATVSPGVRGDVYSFEGQDIVVRGDWTARKFFTGIAFTSTYEFSKPVLTSSGSGSGSVALLEGRTQVRNYRLNYHNTGYLRATVQQQYRTPSEYVFSGKKLGHGSCVIGKIGLYSGQFAIPILSKSDQFTLRIESDSHLPFNLISAEWEAFYNKRSNPA